MAISESNAVTMTAACEIFGRHADHNGPGACSGRILSFTAANMTACGCGCHNDQDGEEELDLVQAVNRAVRGLDVIEDEPAPIEDDELDDLLELEGDRLLEDAYVGGRWFE